MKVKVLTSVLNKSLIKKPVIGVTWLACMITKCYSILFSTFWLLYILSYKGKTISTDKEAQAIYQKVMIASVICGVAFVPLVGKLADRVNPQITVPLSFFVRFLSIVGFYFIKNPAGWYAYLISSVLVLGTLMETVTIDAVLFRNADR